LIPVTKGLADAIAQMMSLQLKKAWIKMLCINETETNRYSSAKVIRTGKPELKGDIQRCEWCSRCRTSNIVIDMNGKNGVVPAHRKEYVQQFLDGFDAMNKLSRVLSVNSFYRLCQ
jgi:hypothetical protein